MNLNEERTLRAIANGARTVAQFRAATKAVSWPQMRRTLESLLEAGLVGRSRGGVLSLTTAGRAKLEPAPAVAMKPYVPPPAPLRRAGSADWEQVPSVAAGKEYDRKV